jgi:RNA polymerase sigma-70 factor (ECF subfamily)
VSDFELPDDLREEMREAWRRYLERVTPFRPALHAYCRRLTRDVWDAEDLAQEALVRGFGTLGRMHDPVRSPRAYLLRVATNAWIDALRRRASEEAALAAADEAPAGAAPAPGAVRDAGAVLLQRLAPQERAAVILKDVFDLSLEESAEVLETTIGAVKAALHRGRTRLRQPEDQPAAHRPLPARGVVDRFVALFNAGDKQGLLELVLDNASVENVGIGFEYGYEGHRGKKSWFEGALGGHPDWPAEWQYESQRAASATYEGEPLVLLFRTRRGREALEVIVRLEEAQEPGLVSRLRAYGFCPETTAEVAAALGLRARTGIYLPPGKVSKA